MIYKCQHCRRREFKTAKECREHEKKCRSSLPGAEVQLYWDTRENRWRASALRVSLSAELKQEINQYMYGDERVWITRCPYDQEEIRRTIETLKGMARAWHERRLEALADVNVYIEE